MSFSRPEPIYIPAPAAMSPPQVPDAPAPPPAVGEAKAPGRKAQGTQRDSFRPTFIGGAFSGGTGGVMNSTTGGKTLLGQ